ncbi:uncharacterized protein LOC123498853 [Portunus trituberculatus]|uniref:uncharacterized protein LOC123498853 n=1 Tax=Portunus trituberculatus TaxID=210409 RepID=UPI001E1CF795|nr:uncharacterized protein LOC123498853 [Portunus trituberculatus]
MHTHERDCRCNEFQYSCSHLGWDIMTGLIIKRGRSITHSHTHLATHTTMRTLNVFLLVTVFLTALLVVQARPTFLQKAEPYAFTPSPQFSFIPGRYTSGYHPHNHNHHYHHHIRHYHPYRHLASVYGFGFYK